MSPDPRVSPTVAGWIAYSLHLLLSGVGSQNPPDDMRDELARMAAVLVTGGTEWPGVAKPAGDNTSDR